MRSLIACLLLSGFSAVGFAQGFITVGQFLTECRQDMDPCIAFVMGVVEVLVTKHASDSMLSRTLFSSTASRFVCHRNGTVRT